MRQGNIQKASGVITSYIETQSSYIEEVVFKNHNVNFTKDRAQILILQEVMKKLNISPDRLVIPTNEFKPLNIDIKV